MFFAIGTFVAAAEMISGDMRAIGMLVGTGIPSWAVRRVFWTLGWFFWLVGGPLSFLHALF